VGIGSPPLQGSSRVVGGNPESTFHARTQGPTKLSGAAPPVPPARSIRSRPQRRRWGCSRSFLLILGCLVALAAPLDAGAGTGLSQGALTQTEVAVLDAINDARVSRGLEPAHVSSALVRAARVHTEDMVANNFFEHGAFSERMRSFGATGPRLGEILGWCNVPRVATAEVLKAWLASPAHRVVLLRPGFVQIGIGVEIARFEGYDNAEVVTVDFAGS
jgi:uncharacterized protein YkwD